MLWISTRGVTRRHHAEDFLDPEAAFLRFAAQYAFIRAEAAFFAAGDIPRREAEPSVDVLSNTPKGFFLGLPGRLAGPCKSSMARVRRSRSSMSEAIMSEMGIRTQDSTAQTNCLF